jgi:hypothetical protein
MFEQSNNQMQVIGMGNSAKGMGSQGSISVTPSTTQTTGISDVVSALKQSQGVVNLSNGVVYNIFTIPTSFTVTTQSIAGAGALTVTQYIFNNSVMNAILTNNGKGAASIVNTFGDGFGGRIYDAYLKSANNGFGIKMNGFTVVATVDSTGDQTSTPFNTLNMNLIAANGQGSVIPIPFDVNEAVRNTQYQVGTLTVNKEFFLSSLTQISYSQPADTVFAWTFFTEASGFKG